MPTESIECTVCGAEPGRGFTVEEKDPPGQLILMCNHATEMFPLDEYDAEALPPESELPDGWRLVTTTDD
jgi:hypothetical protein